MTVKPVHRCYLICDGCGRERFTLGADATTIRIAAAAEGWKFIQYNRRLGGRRKQIGPRQWDACPDCEVPPTVEDAYAIRQSRKAVTGGVS